MCADCNTFVAEEKAGQNREGEVPVTPSRRDKWLIIAAVATLMFIFDGLQVRPNVIYLFSAHFDPISRLRLRIC